MKLGYTLLVLAIARAPEAAPTDGTVTGSVMFVRDGKTTTIGDGYVYLLPVTYGRPPPVKRITASIVQKNKEFFPTRLVIPSGSTVEFPNREEPSRDSDHNVFSPTKPIFDLKRFEPGKSASRTFADAGEYDIYCDLHVWMNAKVKVVDTNYIVPVVDGDFRISGIPAGKYKVVAWAPDSTESKETITVVPGETATVPRLNVQLGKPKPHTRKDGTPYPPDLYKKNRNQ